MRSVPTDNDLDIVNSIICAIIENWHGTASAADDEIHPRTCLTANVEPILPVSKFIGGSSSFSISAGSSKIAVTPHVCVDSELAAAIDLIRGSRCSACAVTLCTQSIRVVRQVACLRRWKRVWTWTCVISELSRDDDCVFNGSGTQWY